MLILALNGSPNKEGNTAYLLNSALAVAEAAGAKTVLLQVSEGVSDAKETFCRCCSTPCDTRCYKGTKLAAMFDLMRQADGLILGSPVHFGTVSAQIKSFWDKTRALRHAGALLNTVGAAVVVGASRFGGQETTTRALHDMMFSQGMTVVGDGYHEYDAGHRGACAQRPSESDDEALKRVRILTRRVLEVAAATRDLRLAKGII
ncbi:MAG: flavodoxin family protein [Geminicoccaceae bacterium]|nr:flavodoxin family protein [Geminicoccaceae bacterium]